MSAPAPEATCGGMEKVEFSSPSECQLLARWPGKFAPAAKVSFPPKLAVGAGVGDDLF